MSGPVFIVGDSLEPGHPGLEVTQADSEEQDAEARQEEEAVTEETTENEDGVEVNEQDAHRDEIADVTPDMGGFSHVHGDTDTAVGGTSEQEVVAADNEQASVDAASAEVAEADATDGEARRQQYAVDGDDVAADESDEDPDGDGPRLTAAETIEKIEASSSVEEVDELSEGDDRVTVQRAADKRKEELADDES